MPGGAEADDGRGGQGGHGAGDAGRGGRGEDEGQETGAPQEEEDGWGRGHGGGAEGAAAPGQVALGGRSSKWAGVGGASGPFAPRGGWQRHEEARARGAAGAASLAASMCRRRRAAEDAEAARRQPGRAGAAGWPPSGSARPHGTSRPTLSPPRTMRSKAARRPHGLEAAFVTAGASGQRRRSASPGRARRPDWSVSGANPPASALPPPASALASPAAEPSGRRRGDHDTHYGRDYEPSHSRQRGSPHPAAAFPASPSSPERPGPVTATPEQRHGHPTSPLRNRIIRSGLPSPARRHAPRPDDQHSRPGRLASPRFDPDSDYHPRSATILLGLSAPVPAGRAVAAAAAGRDRPAAGSAGGAAAWSIPWDATGARFHGGWGASDDVAAPAGDDDVCAEIPSSRADDAREGGGEAAGARGDERATPDAVRASRRSALDDSNATAHEGNSTRPLSPPAGISARPPSGCPGATSATSPARSAAARRHRPPSPSALPPPLPTGPRTSRGDDRHSPPASPLARLVRAAAATPAAPSVSSGQSRAQRLVAAATAAEDATQPPCDGGGPRETAGASPPRSWGDGVRPGRAAAPVRPLRPAASFAPGTSKPPPGMPSRRGPATATGAGRAATEPRATASSGRSASVRVPTHRAAAPAEHSCGPRHAGSPPPGPAGNSVPGRESTGRIGAAALGRAGGKPRSGPGAVKRLPPMAPSLASSAGTPTDTPAATPTGGSAAEPRRQSPRSPSPAGSAGRAGARNVRARSPSSPLARFETSAEPLLRRPGGPAGRSPGDAGMQDAAPAAGGGWLPGGGLVRVDTSAPGRAGDAGGATTSSGSSNEERLSGGEGARSPPVPGRGRASQARPASAADATGSRGPQGRGAAVLLSPQRAGAGPLREAPSRRGAVSARATADGRPRGLAAARADDVAERCAGVTLAAARRRRSVGGLKTSTGSAGKGGGSASGGPAASPAGSARRSAPADKAPASVVQGSVGRAELSEARPLRSGPSDAAGPRRAAPSKSATPPRSLRPWRRSAAGGPRCPVGPLTPVVPVPHGFGQTAQPQLPSAPPLGRLGLAGPPSQRDAPRRPGRGGL